MALFFFSGYMILVILQYHQNWKSLQKVFMVYYQMFRIVVSLFSIAN